MNRLKQLTQQGQSIWLDYTKRSFVRSGGLRRLIDEDGLSGVTSNPSIFDEAISHGDEYDDDIRAARDAGRSAEDAYRDLVVSDIQMVADELAGVFERTGWRDGFVSLEVSPHLARDTAATLDQARDLWTRVKRKNLFIKVPATAEGLPAIRQLIAEGINVNITLLFGLTRYREVAEAYLGGLEDRIRAGESVERIASVASFFLSRIDLMVDPQLDLLAESDPRLAGPAGRLKGQAAIACARQAYQIYQEIFSSDRFRRLAPARPQKQRVLWASTSTKDPAESDVKYVEALIGPETINTLPQKTLEAFRDHGDPTPRLQENPAATQAVLRDLGEIGIDLQAVSRRLEDDGVDKFRRTYDHLIAGLRQKLGALAGAGDRGRGA
ncbi:MAG TPA: transaldolase [Opitutaceae bacterium]|nr:transaldolase [Opitutaceae bacterium]